jgi:hypothetical protein
MKIVMKKAEFEAFAKEALIAKYKDMVPANTVPVVDVGYSETIINFITEEEAKEA